MESIRGKYKYERDFQGHHYTRCKFQDGFVGVGSEYCEKECGSCLEKNSKEKWVRCSRLFDGTIGHELIPEKAIQDGDPSKLDIKPKDKSITKVIHDNCNIPYITGVRIPKDKIYIIFANMTHQTC